MVCITYNCEDCGNFNAIGKSSVDGKRRCEYCAKKARAERKADKALAIKEMEVGG